MPSARIALVAAVLLGVAGCGSAATSASQPGQPELSVTAPPSAMPTGPTSTAASSTLPSTAPSTGPSASASTMPSGLQPTTETLESALASPSVPATVDPNAKVIYLTFDDGPWVPYTQQMLKVLKQNDATATFFVVGEMVKEHPTLVPKILAAGHAVGNHTWNHPNLTTLSDPEIKQQVRSTTKVVGSQMSPCMRPPYGATNDHIRALVKSLGYRTVLWTDWAVDWEQPPIPTFLGYLKKATHNHANILLHDGGGDRPNTVQAMRIMLPRWRKQGYTFQSVPACLKPAP